MNANPTSAMFARKRFEITDADLAEIDASTKVYVKKSALGTYRSMLSRFYSNYATMFNYQIPLPLSGKYSTFAREFDTDFSEANVSGTKDGWPNVIAFTAGDLGRKSNGDNYIVMRSINENAAQGDGTYIPANTGVLLAATDGSAENFYYQIHETDLPVYAGANLMRGVTEYQKYVQPTEGSYTNYLLSNGEFLKMTVRRLFPAHKAYLQIPTSAVAAGAKLMMVFDDDDAVVTAVDVLESGAWSQETGDVYDLQGRKVANPTKGVYVRNGKKFVIK